MKKIAALLLLLVFVAGCSPAAPQESPASESSAPASSSERSSASASSEPAEPQTQTETRLLNDREWFQLHGGTPTGALDELAFSAPDDDVYITDASYRPSAWPHAQIDGRIPEYKGQGRLWELFITHPGMSNRPSDARMLILGFYDYDKAELQSYIDSLADFGFEEVDIPEFSDAVASLGGTARGFASPDCILHITSNKDSYGEYITFSLSFLNVQSYSLDTSPTAGTRLQNYFQWCESNNFTPDESISADELAEQFKDDRERDNYIILSPSKWPKEILGELFPEFAGEGMMVYYLATNLAEFPGEENTLILSLFIDEFDRKDLDTYHDALEAFGFYDVTEEHALLTGEENSTMRTFRMPGYRCVSIVKEVMGKEMIQLTFWFDARYYQQTGIA